MYRAIPSDDTSETILGEVRVFAALKRTDEARAALHNLEAKYGEYYTQIAEGYLALVTATDSGRTANAR